VLCASDCAWRRQEHKIKDLLQDLTSDLAVNQPEDPRRCVVLTCVAKHRMRAPTCRATAADVRKALVSRAKGRD
jgi:hypothetical protein